MRGREGGGMGTGGGEAYPPVHPLRIRINNEQMYELRKTEIKLKQGLTHASRNRQVLHTI